MGNSRRIGVVEKEIDISSGPLHNLSLVFLNQQVQKSLAERIAVSPGAFADCAKGIMIRFQAVAVAEPDISAVRIAAVNQEKDLLSGPVTPVVPDIFPEILAGGRVPA